MMPLALSSRSRPMPGSWSLPKPLAFAFSCAPPLKGTTCGLNRLLRHGSHGRPYIGCDTKVSRKNGVALCLQDVPVLIHSFEPTQTELPEAGCWIKRCSRAFQALFAPHWRRLTL